MDSVHRLPPSDVLGPVQFFAVPVTAVRDADEQRQAWLWYGDTMTPIEKGAYVPADNGWLDFVPVLEKKDEDGGP